MATVYAKLTPESGEPMYPIKAAKIKNIDVPEGYTHAEVVQGAWIFYEEPFDKESDGSYEILEEGDKKELGFLPKSCRMLPKGANKIILFQHPKFYGKMQVYSQGCDDIPADDQEVNSGIIYSTMRWLLYTDKKYGGVVCTHPPGKFLNAEDFGFGENCKIQSIRPE